VVLKAKALKQPLLKACAPRQATRCYTALLLVRSTLQARPACLRARVAFVALGQPWFRQWQWHLPSWYVVSKHSK